MKRSLLSALVFRRVGDVFVKVYKYTINYLWLFTKLLFTRSKMVVVIIPTLGPMTWVIISTAPIFWGGAGVRYSTQVWVVVFHPGCQTHNLGLFKWNTQTTPPPQIKDAKWLVFLFARLQHWFCRGGGLGGFCSMLFRPGLQTVVMTKRSPFLHPVMTWMFGENFPRQPLCTLSITTSSSKTLALFMKSMLVEKFY